MINRKPALTHPLFAITVRELVATVPADAEQDDIGRVVPSLNGEDL
jgi:hypothetical protein